MAIHRSMTASTTSSSTAVAPILRAFGLQPHERFRSLGAGHGQPLLQSQEASWHELPVHLEPVVTAAGRLVEAALALPAMEELIARVDESSWWELVDVFAAACDAAHGALVTASRSTSSPPPMPPAGAAASRTTSLCWFPAGLPISCRPPVLSTLPCP